MSDNEADVRGANVRIPPPLAAALTIIVGYLLGRVAPIFPAFDLATPMRYWLGTIIIVAAIGVLGAWPMRLFNRSGQNVTPWSATPEIIVLGPYHFTRNPMYLMMVLVCFACALIFSEVWHLILTPILGVSLYHIAIKHEEIYLEEKFGDSYRAYKRSVRRWI